MIFPRFPTGSMALSPELTGSDRSARSGAPGAPGCPEPVALAARPSLRRRPCGWPHSPRDGGSHGMPMG